MEDRRSLTSFRRILSFSKNRRGDVSLANADDRPPTGFITAVVRKLGFLGSITAVVATVILIIWAYAPDYWLKSIEIYYHPSRFGQQNMCLPFRYWPLCVPTYVMATIVLAIGIYTGLDFLATPPPTSLKSMFDECSKELVSGVLSANDDEQAIEGISDICINQVGTVS